MRKNQVEILAPAGNKEAFIGAINAGADAIYLSGKNYGARKYAENFSKEEIVELIRYAHLRAKKVYVTINTLIFESEIEELLAYSDFLVNHSVDALIIQDLGIIQEFVRRYPDTEIHASTQMNTFNLEQVKWLESIGVSRIILARETSVDTISRMKETAKIDLEVFVHGALCISYSGNCLFSSMNGGRSGNRGECAQPCRLKYKLYRDNDLIENDSYLLSAKDLLTIDNLDKIINSGVKSLKIEGRMKKAEYVIATVRAYREAVDNVLNESDFDLNERISELLSVFNREYTKGYILDEEPYKINNAHRPNHLGTLVGKVLSYNRGKTVISLNDTLSVGDGIRILGEVDSGGQVSKIIKNYEAVETAYKNDIITIDMPQEVAIDSEVMKTLDRRFENSLHNYLNETYSIIGLEVFLIAKIGERLKVSVKPDNADLITLTADYYVEKAMKQGQTQDMLATQFNKLGNTYFYVKSMHIDADENVFIPNAVINDLRRNALEIIEQNILTKPKPRIIESPFVLHIVNNIQKEMLIVKVETNEQYLAAIDAGIKTIYISERMFKSEISKKEDNHYFLMNRIWHDLDKYVGFDKLVIRDIGGLSLAKDIEIISDWTVNATNSLSVSTLFKNGVQRVTLSPENSFENIKRIVANYKTANGQEPDLELIVYGKADLMLTKYCPITKSEGVFRQNCNLCERNAYRLVNEKNDYFRLVRDGYCNLRILHSKPLNLIEYVQEIIDLGIKSIRLDFTDESQSETKMIINAFRNVMMKQPYIMPNRYYTYGRFLR